MVEQRPFKPLVVGSTPTAPTKSPVDSVALTPLDIPILGAEKGGFCAQIAPNSRGKIPEAIEPKRPPQFSISKTSLPTHYDPRREASALQERFSRPTGGR